MAAVAGATPYQFNLAAACSHRQLRGKGEFKAAEIAGMAGACTLLISCTATEQAESAKR